MACSSSIPRYVTVPAGLDEIGRVLSPLRTTCQIYATVPSTCSEKERKKNKKIKIKK
jgi:hypothetical protein